MNIIFKKMKTPHYAPLDSLYFQIIYTDTFEETGYVCFQNLDFKKGTTNLAYRTYKKYQGCGFMSYVLPKVVEYVFEILPLETIYAEIRKNNIPSLSTIKYLDIQERTPKEDFLRFYIRKGR